MSSSYFERDYSAEGVFTLRVDERERVFADHNSSLQCYCPGCKAIRDHAAESDMA